MKCKGLNYKVYEGSKFEGIKKLPTLKHEYFSYTTPRAIQKYIDHNFGAKDFLFPHTDKKRWKILKEAINSANKEFPWCFYPMLLY
jgi:hypothetical protein